MKKEFIQKWNCKDLSEFREAAREVFRHLPDRMVLALSGPMGAGKTEMVKLLCEQQGVRDVVSPTYALHHRYPLKTQGDIEHLDLFRMENEEELDSTGFWDFFFEKQGWIFIEWPEKMNLEQIPDDWSLFLLDLKVDGDSRELSLFRR